MGIRLLLKRLREQALSLSGSGWARPVSIRVGGILTESLRVGDTVRMMASPLVVEGWASPLFRHSGEFRPT